jgi:bifunctional non-homologous end joining protein LigD
MRRRRRLRQRGPAPLPDRTRGDARHPEQSHIQLRVQNERVTLKTRKGLDWTGKFGAIARDAKSLPNAIIDGEIVALDENGAPDFTTLQAALSEQETDDLIFYAFDHLFDVEADLRPQPLSDRKARLQTLLADHGSGDAARIRFVKHLETGGDAVLKSACRLALEGIVSKRLDSPYRSGRTDSWTKAKCRAGHEVVGGGWTTTNGNSALCWLASIAASISSMSAASAQDIARPR